MKKIIVILFILIIVPCSAFANAVTEQFEKSNIKDALNIKNEIFPEFNSSEIVETLSSGKMLEHENIVKKIVSYFLKEFYAILKMCITILGIGFVSGILNTLGESFSSKGTVMAGKIEIYAVFASISVSVFLKVITPAVQSIENIGLMIKSSIPVLIGMTALSGGVITANVMNSVLLIMLSAVEEIMSKVVFPLILGSVALSVANNMSDRINIKISVATLRQIAKWIIIFAMAIYTGFFGIYGISGAVMDKTVTKAVRFAIGTSVPIVGGVLADSVETILTTLGAVRNITGIVCIIVVVITLLTPVLKTASAMWCFKICCAFLEPFCDKNALKLALDISECLFLVFAVLVCIMILFSGCIGIILISGNMIG